MIDCNVEEIENIDGGISEEALGEAMCKAGFYLIGAAVGGPWAGAFFGKVMGDLACSA